MMFSFTFYSVNLSFKLLVCIYSKLQANCTGSGVHLSSLICILGTYIVRGGEVCPAHQWERNQKVHCETCSSITIVSELFVVHSCSLCGHTRNYDLLLFHTAQHIK